MSGNPLFCCTLLSLKEIAQDTEPKEATLAFPATREEVQRAFDCIGINDSKDFDLIEFDSRVPGLQCVLGRESIIDELNYLAVLISEMKPEDKKIFEAAIDQKDIGRKPREYINLALNLDKFILLEGVCNEADYGLALHQDAISSYTGLVQDLKNSKDINIQAVAVYIRTLERYFDVEYFGQEMAKNEQGKFSHLGYIKQSRPLEQKYNNIPEKHIVTKSTDVCRTVSNTIRRNSKRHLYKERV